MLGQIRRVALRAVLMLLTGVLAAAAVWTWISLSYSFSDGERAGYVQKFSHKGWVCKTWEGELALVNLPGAMPEIFAFTVRDDTVAKQIQSLVGRRVALTYEQHVGVPSSCFGDTAYFVTKVRAID
jgi:hypothetical protein